MAIAHRRKVWSFLGSKAGPQFKQAKTRIVAEDISGLMLMELDNGCLCFYGQCHYAPDAWRNYTLMGTSGRIENDGDAPGDGIKLRLATGQLELVGQHLGQPQCIALVGALPLD